MKIITNAQCAGYSQSGHPEKPARVLKTLEKLRSQTTIPISWEEPGAAEEDAILRAHSAEHVARLREPVDFDADTPWYPDIATYARASAGAALAAQKAARAGEHVFSLMRPPGHHATREVAMGFCYLNNVAIAVLEAMAAGVNKVAVYDFDVHHGNGTEEILLNREGTAFYSIHQSPCYPGTGTANRGSNCFNYPVAPGLPREEYRKTFARALADLILFKPDLVAVSAGFDAYARDPLAQETLEAEDFYWLGRNLRDVGVPIFNVLEGGYSKDLPELIFSYLGGLSAA